jgi:hypothetical protein
VGPWLTQEKGQAMLTSEEEAYILEYAYVPEHCISLMTLVSGGEPFLIDDYFICHKDNWIILIGYPLEDNFNTENFKAVFSKVREKFRPDYISLVAPEMPSSLASDCQESESDVYFTLQTQQTVIYTADTTNGHPQSGETQSKKGTPKFKGGVFFQHAGRPSGTDGGIC